MSALDYINAIADQLSTPARHGGGGLSMRDPLDEAYYNAQLKQWLADQEHDYDAASVNRLAPILANMEKNTLLPSERIKMGFMKDIASGDNGALLPSM